MTHLHTRPQESWATYIEAAWVEDHEKRDEFEYEMWCNASGYFSECSSYQRPIVTRYLPTHHHGLAHLHS